MKPQRDVRDAEIVKEIPVHVAEAIHGVTFDGKSVWFAADGGDLVAIDPATGKEIVRRTSVGCRAGVTFDGTHLWAICGREIQKIDPTSNQVLASVSLPAGAEVSGMAWAEGALYVGDYAAKKILKIDPKTGEVLRTIKLDRMVTGVTWADGELWHGSWPQDGATGGLHAVDPETGKERLHLRLPEPQGVSGIEYDAEHGLFWCGQHDAAPAGATGKRLRAVRKPRR